jgi:hypothetical protein
MMVETAAIIKCLVGTDSVELNASAYSHKPINIYTEFMSNWN